MLEMDPVKVEVLYRGTQGPIEESPLINTSMSLIDQGSEESINESNIIKVSRNYSAWSPEMHGATLVWRDLNVYYRPKDAKAFKRIVNNVTGAVKAGNLVALMGSSGAGKTTLMNALAYRNPSGIHIDGDIIVNGRKIGPFMHRLSGFMHQEDIFVECLTVEEHLNFMARLKMDRRTPAVARIMKVRELIRQVGLWGSRHTRIGLDGDEKLLSGGERKRLAFATELLTNPMLLFCDEPTTGLDFYSAQKLVGMMSTMANQGRTIICTIHQPSSEIFSMFDQLILVADGRIAFNGTTKSALEFFESLGYTCPRNFNPADFFIRTLASVPGSEDATRIAVKRICDEFTVSDAAKEIDVTVQLELHMMKAEAPANNIETNNEYLEIFWWTKLYWLTYRSLLQVLRDPTVQAMRLFQKVLIGITAGLCYIGTDTMTQHGVQSVQGALFILISENTFTPMYSTLAMFPQEFPLFQREYRSGLYSTALYYFSKLLALFPGVIAEPLIFALIAYWMAGLRATVYAFTMTLLITAMVMNVATACGCMFSCAFDSIALGMAYLIPFDYTLMITSGLFVKLSSLPSYISWVRFLSWLMYSNEAMTIIQWENVSNITCDANPTIPCLHNGEEILENYSFTDTHLWSDIFAMLGLYVVFHALGFTFLHRRAKRK